MVPSRLRSHRPTVAGRSRPVVAGLLVLLIGLFGTGLAVREETGRQQEAAHAEAERRADQFAAVLDAHLQRYADVGAGLAEAVAHEPHLDPETFSTVVGQALQRTRLAGVLDIGYVARGERDPGAPDPARDFSITLPSVRASGREGVLVLSIPVVVGYEVAGRLEVALDGQDVLTAATPVGADRAVVSIPGPDGESVLVGTIPASPRPTLDPERTVARELVVYQQRWRVESEPGAPSAPLWRTTPGETLLTGVLVTAALAVMAFVVMRSRDRLSREVHVRTEELQEANAGLAAANAELERAARSKDELLAVVSHELRTPLTVIRGLASALLTFEREELPTLAAQSLDKIDRNAERLDDLVADLLLSAQLTSGEVVAEPQATPVAARLEALAADPAHASLDISVEVDDDPVAMVDRAQLDVMIRSLLANVGKYGRAPVTLLAAPVDGWVEVTVRDAGDGVPTHLRPALFQPFTQAEMSNQRTSTGTGLGLSIVRQLSELNGGTARYEHDDTGPAFIIRLPAA